MTGFRRRLPFGAEPDEAGVDFRLWAPAQDEVHVRLGDGRRARMTRDEEGFFGVRLGGGAAGMRYRFELGRGGCVPDPASRFQPEDVAGPSEIVDPAAYAWADARWRGRPWREALVYEAHVGCFSPSGDYDGMRWRLDHLERVGVTALELMPVADFDGRRNWGYDGVLPFAPDAAYGRPEALKRLVDECHGRGLMVLLDVVYNHFGPSGNFLGRYAPDFFHPDIHTPWGAALAFDNPMLRLFFTENALYWLREFHFDGLRLDAVHAIEAVPGGAEFLAELVARVRGEIRDREVHLVLENDRNEARWLPQPDAPMHYTAQWNDDFHHAAHVLAAGERDGYYADYLERPAHHLARALAEGFAYQGEVSDFRGGRRRGEPSAAVPPVAFVNFLQNHDQVGNRALGERLNALAPRTRLRALYTLLFLSPQVPLLFMGEEWAASTPFLFFCDFPGELGAAVRAGRRDEFRRFAAFADPSSRARIPDPTDPATFGRSRLDWEEPAAAGHAEWLAFIGGLSECRRANLVPRLALMGSGRWRASAADAFVVEWPCADGGCWRAEANFGAAPVALAAAGEVVHFELPERSVLLPNAVRVSRDG